MLAFVFRRILYMIPTLFGVALIGFLLFNLVGGDPVLLMVGKHANQQRIDELRHELGLDQSIPMQFVDYLKDIVTLDFGRSYATKRNISDMLSEGIGPSMSLAIIAFSTTVILAILISLLVAYFRGRFIDKTVVVFCVMGMSISALAFLLFGQYVLAYRLGWFPISGYDDDWSHRIYYLALPAIIWVTISLGTDVRFFRTAILDETYQDYVRTARAKGLSEPKIFLKHVLKNSMIPIITWTVIEIPFLIFGSLLLENFFGIPGLGSITVDAFNNTDWPVLKAMLVVFAFLFMVGQLLSDILYSLVDPRITLR